MLKKHPGLCIIIAILAAIPMIFAEYRRIVLGLFDATYWVLGAFLLISVYCLYQVVGSMFMSDYNGMSSGERSKKKLDPFTVKCNALAVCVLVIGIFAFIVSGVISLLF